MHRRVNERFGAPIPSNDPLYNPPRGNAPAFQATRVGGQHALTYGGQQGGQPRLMAQESSGSRAAPGSASGSKGQTAPKLRGQTAPKSRGQTAPKLRGQTASESRSTGQHASARLNIPRRPTPPPTQRPLSSQSGTHYQTHLQEPWNYEQMNSVGFGSRSNEGIPGNLPGNVPPPTLHTHSAGREQTAWDEVDWDEGSWDQAAWDRIVEDQAAENRAAREHGYAQDEFADPALLSQVRRATPPPKPLARRKRVTDSPVSSGSSKGNSGKQRQTQRRKAKK